MNAPKTILFRFLYAVVALLYGGALFAGSFTLDPRSPSWPDSNDILRDEPGPLSALPRLGVSANTLGLLANDWINALSDGRDPIDQDGVPGQMHLIFSVRRGSTGLPGTGVEQEGAADTAPPAGGLPDGQASDLFTWDGIIGMNSLANAALGWASGLGGDESATNLRIPNGINSGDNVDAYDRSTMRVFNPADAWNPGNPDNPDADNPWGGGAGGGGGGGVFPPYPIFFSLRSGSPTLAVIGAFPGDILVVGGLFGGTPVVFVSHVTLGIPAGADLDALNLEVRQDAFGNLVPHRIRFSVRSATTGFALAGGTVVSSGADVLLYDGAVTTLAYTANDLGLDSEDDLDALESEITPFALPDLDVDVVPFDPEVFPGFGVLQPKSRTVSAGPAFRRGDADGNGHVQLADAIAVLKALFAGDADLPCEDAADASDDGAVTIADAVVALDALFIGNVMVPAPGMSDCGEDPTSDTLTCDLYDACD